MPVHLIRLTGAALLAAAVAGCPTAPGDPMIKLGTGEPGEEFVPLSDGDTLLVIQGPQGCCHVNGSFQVAGVEPGDPDDLGQSRNPTMVFELLVEGSTIVMSGDAKQGLEDAPSSAAPYTHEFIGRRVLLDILSDDPYDGTDGVFSIDLEDADGIHLSETLDVWLEAHPFNE